MKEILNHLFEYKTLTKDEAKAILTDISQGKYTHVQIASFLTVYMMRSITVAELAGFRDAMLELCLSVDLSEYDPMDVCGTGGDGKDTFNISTLASFVVAGSGQRMAKHGNYGVSSACGSSTVMEYLGYKFTNDKDALRRQIDRSGICFLHAPLFHPAMKNVAPVRKELGVRSFFNMLGPMINPAFPKKQMVGVFSLELARLYAYLYQQTDKQFVILHALDGYDEISLTGGVKMISDREEQVVQPEMMHLPTLAAESLHGGNTVEEAAHIFMNVLNGQGTPAQQAAVVANAGMALYTARPSLSLPDAVLTARESLDSGKALQAFRSFMSAN
jgi:anthranilate phosphoribosyltransferase